MCFGNSVETGSSTVKLPEWVESGGKDVLAKAQNFYSQPYKAYEGERVAGPNNDMNAAFAGLRDLFARPDVSGEAMDMVRAGSGSAADGIGKFMNPYLEQVLGTAIRKVNESADTERKRIGSTAHMSGAFGDARQGILEGEAGQRTKTAIGDVTGSIGGQAFNTALGASQADLQRLLTGAGALTSANAGGTSDMLTRLTALLSGGKMQQSGEQAKLDAAYGESKAGDADQYNKLDALIRALGGAAGTGGKTETKSAPDNSGFEALGGIAGTLLSMI